MFFKKYFERRKFRVVRFGEVEVKWKNDTFTVYSVIFSENDNDERKWSVTGGTKQKVFYNTSFFAQCETWKHTGLFPDWAKDPLAEKLSR